MFRYFFHILVFIFIWNSSFGRNKIIADSCLDVLRNTPEIPEEQKCELLYKILLNNTDYDSCIFYADCLIDLAKKINNSYFICHGYYEKGQSLFFLDKVESAIPILLRSLEESQKNGFKLESAFSFYSLSNSYFKRNNTTIAIEYLKKATSIFEELKENKYLTGTYYQLGNIYYATGISDSALIYYNKAFVGFKQENNYTALAYISGNIGAVQTKLNQYDSARSNLLYAIDELTKLLDYQSVIKYFVLASNNELSDKKLPKALEYAQDALQVVNLHPSPDSRRDVFEQLANVFQAMGDFANAYKYQKEFYLLRDSLINIDVVTKMANMRTEFEVSQKQAEVDILEDKNRLKNRLVLFISLGLIVVSLLLFIIYHGYRKKLALNRKLRNQKKSLAARKMEIEALNNAKDRLFSIISHDLRGPVGSLNNLASYVVVSLNEHQYKDAEDLAVAMSESSQQVEFLLDNLLHWSINMQELYKPRKAAFDLNKLINEVISVYFQIIRSKQIQLAYLPFFSEFVIESDSNCWAVIIRNLVNNAIKFTPIGGRIELSSCYMDEFVTVKVLDNGLGMNKEQVDKLFDFTTKKSQWGTKNEKGQGLGLCLVNDFVVMLEGTIKIDSEPGFGSCFTISIPACLVKHVDNIAIKQMHVENEMK